MGAPKQVPFTTVERDSANRLVEEWRVILSVMADLAKLRASVAESRTIAKRILERIDSFSIWTRHSSSVRAALDIAMHWTLIAHKRGDVSSLGSLSEVLSGLRRFLFESEKLERVIVVDDARADDSVIDGIFRVVNGRAKLLTRAEIAQLLGVTEEALDQRRKRDPWYIATRSRS